MTIRKVQMSSIAQKLCDEICEESPNSHAKPSKHGTRDSYRILPHASSSRYNGRPTRSIIVEKKKVVNKLVPTENSSRGKIINKFKSRETLLNKKFVDTGLNTIITGPLKCDNDCVTMVRRRDSSKGCKCGHKGLKCRTSAKEIQTFEFKNLMDKACAYRVETVNCGTQYAEKLSSSVRIPHNKSRVKLYSEVTQTRAEPIKETIKNSKRSITLEDSGRSTSGTDVSASRSKGYNYMAARRWALSHYPTRGPDF